jgi:hypothetical protein
MSALLSTIITTSAAEATLLNQLLNPVTVLSKKDVRMKVTGSFLGLERIQWVGSKKRPRLAAEIRATIPVK